MTTLLQLPTELGGLSVDRAADLLRQYFDTSLNGEYYSGAFFERLDGGGDRAGVRNRFTGADLVAVKMLSIRVPQDMVREMRARDAEFRRLLEQIPYDVDLVDADPKLVDESSAAWDLWERLKTVHGVEWVVANKLLARKRPRLLPVYDNDVRGLLGTPADFWASLRQTLAADDHDLHRRLLNVRDEAGVGDDISPLRVFDVVCWMVAQERKPAGLDEQDREAGSE